VTMGTGVAGEVFDTPDESPIHHRLVLDTRQPVWFITGAALSPGLAGIVAVRLDFVQLGHWCCRMGRHACGGDFCLTSDAPCCGVGWY